MLLDDAHELMNLLRYLVPASKRHLDLDFAAICRGYTNDYSAYAIYALGESLLPHTQFGGQASLRIVGDGGSPCERG